MDCSYHDDKPSHTAHSRQVYIIIGVTALFVVVSITVILSLFYWLYWHRDKKSSDFVQLVQDELNDENGHHNNIIIDHHDNITNDQLALSVQNTEEAGNSGDQLQVGLATLTEPSQSQFSNPTMEEIIHAKFKGEYHPYHHHHGNLMGTTVALL